ncbi:hypothetical protein [Anabaena azotica]|uniref:hypothetical protein n=1 Tax=Anabaena azotica TaxID=197653 RepID=UPI0039A5FDE6
MKDTKGRFIFIDGLRDLAAMAVAGFHFYNGGPLREPLSNIFPSPLSLMLKYGWLGVEVFFISGFVIAFLAFVLAIVTAYIIYLLVEKPSIELSKKFQIEAVS